MRWALSLFLPVLVGTTALGYPVSSSTGSFFDELERGLAIRNIVKRGQCAAGGRLGKDIRGSIGASDCPQDTGFEFDASKGRITAKTNLATDGVAKRVNKKPSNPTCDHILEINILVSVLEEDGGVCDILGTENLTADDEKARISELRNIVNGERNLIFYTSVAEDMKTALVQNFQKGQAPTAVTVKPIHFLSMIDYLEKTLSDSTATAAALDAKIQELFPGAKGSVSTKWAEFIAYAKATETLTRAAAQKKIDKEKAKIAENQKRKEQCAGGPSDNGNPPAPPAQQATRRLRMIRRYARPGFSANMNPLERRAPTSPRSGPRAPPAPSCPLPGATRKKTVPAAKAITKPPPTRGTRRVAVNSPAPKAPRPKKVTPRPANRPRRAVGKASPPKRRVTPAKKPKVVPKPPAKARGKPRGRGRR